MRSSHPKYRHKNVDSTTAQHSPSEPLLDQLMQTTKITDLNDDCLERIFMLLDVENLLNVKLANKWLGPAADIVYKRKFGTYSVCLYSVHNTQIHPGLLRQSSAKTTISILPVSKCVFNLCAALAHISHIWTFTTVAWKAHDTIMCINTSTGIVRIV